MTADHELLARRLAHLIWNTVPDDGLRQALQQVEPLDPERVAWVADGMLLDRRASAGVTAFYRHWLDLDGLEELLKPEGYAITPELAADMRAEVDALVTRLTFDGGHFRELFFSGTAQVTAALAEHYGVQGTFGPGLSEVQLPTIERTGLFTTAAVLARFSSKSQPSWPAHRGVLVTTNLLCQLIPPEPPNLGLDQPPMLPVRESAEAGKEAACQGCHVYLDPPGYAFLQYDTLGRWDTSGAPFDNSGHLAALPDDPSFADRDEMFELLAGREETAACFTSLWLRRGLDVDDTDAGLPESAAASVAAAAAGFEASGQSLRQAIVEVTKTPAFVSP